LGPTVGQFVSVMALWSAADNCGLMRTSEPRHTREPRSSAVADQSLRVALGTTCSPAQCLQNRAL